MFAKSFRICKSLILLAFYRAYSRRFEAVKISYKALIALKKIMVLIDFCCNDRGSNFIKVYKSASWTAIVAFLSLHRTSNSL